MKESSGHDVKACRHCGVLNYVPDSESRPQMIQCVACGQNISLNGVPSVIHGVTQILLSRRRFNTAVSLLVGAILGKTVDITYDRWVASDKKEGIEPEMRSVYIQPEPASAVVSASIGPVVLIGAAKAGSVFTAELNAKEHAAPKTE